MSAQTRLEALHTYNGKQEPEEANQERNTNKKWRCLLQTTQNDLRAVLVRCNCQNAVFTYGGTVGDSNKADNPQTAHHTKHKQVVTHFQTGYTQDKGNPERHNRDEI